MDLKSFKLETHMDLLDITIEEHGVLIARVEKKNGLMISKSKLNLPVPTLKVSSGLLLRTSLPISQA